MRKRKEQSRKLMTFLLAFLMAFGCVNIFPVSIYAEEPTYEIYPNPHLIKYQSGDFDIQKDVNIVYEDGIDEYTKSRMKEVLKIKNIESTLSQNVKEGKTNILLGIKDSKQYVDEYVSQHYSTQTKNLFDQLDSYFFVSDNNTIIILGKDTDAVFYGLTSLYHIFNQMKDMTIKNFVVEDYADVASRGFIEGYYGNPWSTEDRIQLMKWGGYYKLNSYFYAPKDDPKHNAKWRELYTEKEIETKIKPLAKAGNESKCRFVFALHPYMNNPIRYSSEENYQNDLKVMQAKFAQVIEAGVRQIAILADDAGNVGGDNYVRTLTDMTAWIKEMQETYPDLKLTLPFCTQEYMGNGQGYYANFPDNVQIVMTGGRVWGEVSNSFTTTFTNNVGRGPYLWINWPCTDNSKKHLIMGGYSTFLHPGVNPNKIQGIVLNPMQQSEPSKVAIFGNACYSWNIWESAEQANQCWKDSFKYVDHNTPIETNASNALRELSKHMINQNMDGRVTALQESVDLKAALTDVKNTLNAGGTVDVDKIDQLIHEFTVLQKAAKTYRNQAGDTRVKDQIVYWLNCWDDTTDAAIAYLNALKAVQDQADNSEIWDFYSKGQAAFEKSKTYGFHYVDHTEYAEVGVQHIVPFIKTMESYLSDIASTIVDPSKQIIKFITNRDDTPTGGSTDVLDNNPNSEIVFKSPNSISEGTYVGVSYSKPINIDNVIFRLGANANLNDTFAQAKVQYTVDGKTWTDLNEEVYTLPKEVILENIGLKDVKGIRMIATVDKANTWLGVRDIVINPTQVSTPEVDNGTLTVDKVGVKIGALNNLLNNDNNAYAHFAESPYKPEGATYQDYVPVDATITLTFNEPKKIGTIHFAQDSGTDKITKYVIEYTLDGTKWETLQEYNGDAKVELDASNITAKAVRIRNLELNLQADQKSGYWWKVYSFNVTEPDKENATFMYTDTWTVYEGSIANLTDGSDNTDVEFNTKPGDTTRVGDYIGWDFGKTIEVGKVHAAIGGKRDAGNKWTQYSLQYSLDGQTWTTYKSYTGVNSGKDIIDENLLGIEARYVRFVNNEQRNKWLIFSEFTVKEFDPIRDYDDTYVYTNTDYRVVIANSEALSILTYSGDITLDKGQYIGLDLSRIKDLSNIDYKLTNGDNLTLQVSKNKVDWENIKVKSQDLPDARYVRLINQTDKPITFSIDKFEVHSDEIYAPSLYEATMGINGSWGVQEDSRENGAAFDGNIDTTTEFADLPQEGQYIIYDLGQQRNISKIQMFCQDSAVNYIRDADILISNDLENWTKVVTIGDGIENKGDANIICINSDAGYKASSTYPNKVFVEGTVDSMQARYLKILMTATNNNRAVLFNEIVINDGEYVPISNDPTFTSNVIEEQGFIPQNMIDGSLTSAYKPHTNDAGYIIYTLSDHLDVNKLNIIQKGEISHAKVLALVDSENGREWVQVGTLDKSLNEIYLPFWPNIYELKIEWEVNQIPTISEIVMLNGKEYDIDHSELTEYINHLDIKENEFTASTYKQYSDALLEAQKVNANNNSTTLQINHALENLKTTVALLMKRGDMTLVQNELDKINTLTKDDYTEVSWQQLQEVVKKAQELLKEDATEITETKVFDMVDQLQKSKALLITKVSVSKEVLQNYINTNELDKLDTTKYLTTTVKPFVDALKVAHDLIASDNATVKQLEDALTTLQQARDALILKATDDEVKALKTLIDSYKEDQYTASSWKEFNEVLNSIQTALEEENSHEDIQKLVTRLNDAAKELVKRGDLTNLKALLEVANAIDKTKYTQDSYQDVLDVIKKIEKQLEDTSELVQDDVDALEKELQKALDNLVENPVVVGKPVPTPVTNSNKTGDSTQFVGFIGLGVIAMACIWMLLKKKES